MTRPRLTLPAAAAEFAKHPSPWMIGVTAAAALTARVIVGGWHWWEALIPLALLAAMPVTEWLIHVLILHARPRTVLGIRFDSLLARKHREHHGAPRELPQIFIPWQSLLVLAPPLLAIALLAFPSAGVGLTFLASVAILALGYEWTHYLIHTDYRPRHAPYHRVWRNHRDHHFKNEHYWFTVTTSGTADRLLGTCPEAASVPTSPTARNLHG